MPIKQYADVQVVIPPPPPLATEHFKVNDIIEYAWGYDQTNWYFYKVLGVTERSVRIRRLEHRVVSGNPIDVYKVVPEDKFHPDPREVEQTRRVKWGYKPGEVCITLRFGHGCKWSGTPKSATGYA